MPPHSNLQGLSKYNEIAKPGEPIWEFLHNKWPYGTIDFAKNNIFFRGLMMPTAQGKKGYCTPQETIRRLSFAKDDEAHVERTFETAYHAFVALKLVSNREGCMSKDFKHISWRHLDLTLNIIQQNPVIKHWFNPPQQYIHSLYQIIKKNGTQPQCGQGEATLGPPAAAVPSTAGQRGAAAKKALCKQ